MPDVSVYACVHFSDSIAGRAFRSVRVAPWRSPLRYHCSLYPSLISSLFSVSTVVGDTSASRWIYLFEKANSEGCCVRHNASKINSAVRFTLSPSFALYVSVCVVFSSLGSIWLSYKASLFSVLLARFSISAGHV